MENNPYDSPQSDPARRPSCSARHVQATVVIFVLVLLSIVISLLFFV